MSAAQPESSVVFFLDKTHGLLIRRLLKGVGLEVKVHGTLGWSDDKPDVEWIAECGKNNWAILSGDKSIEVVPEERQAVIDAKVKVFMFEDTDLTRTEDWAAAFLVGRQRILEIASRTSGPLFVTLKPCRVRGHVSQPRFITAAGAGWQLQEMPATSSVAERPKSKRVSKKRQSELFDPGAQTIAVS